MLRLFCAMRISYPILILFLLFAQLAFAQSVTGVWRGKISKGLKSYNLELKLIRVGDSLTGTAYYYSGAHYARFAVKGNMTMEGDVLWWDEALINTSGNSFMIPNKTAQLFAADFNCPGEDIMKLDGNAVKKDDDGQEREKPSEVHLNKVVHPLFEDGWDEVIQDFPYYAGQPKMIRDIEKEQLHPQPNDLPQRGEVARTSTANPQPVVAKEPIPVAEPTRNINVEEMFQQRKKVYVSDIPVTADSILLRFYDHAEIDGDSIALFMNGKLMQKHILLAAEPIEFWINANDLNDENELTMVAENLGTIPPNTSLLIAWCAGIRYEAKLESTEGTSATVRLIKKKPASTK